MTPFVPVLLLALFILGGLQTYRMIERRHRQRWVALAEVPDPEPERPFRAEAGPTPTKLVVIRDRAPGPIRRLALWSLYMGQMSIPGGLLGFIGLFVAGVGVVAVPGMILAIRIWRLGVWLLRKDARAEREAETLASFAIVLNVVAITVGVIVAVVSGGAEVWLLPLVLAVYGAVSFAHAVEMRRCAKLLAAMAETPDPLAPATQPATTTADAAEAWAWADDARARATRPRPAPRA